MTRPQNKNLVPFVKGDDPRRNVTGENKGSIHLTATLRIALAEIGKGNKEPYYILFIQRVLKKAIVDGNEAMIKLIWEYLEGKPKETHDVTGKVEFSWKDYKPKNQGK